MVNLNFQIHRVIIHPILQERVPTEFLSPSKHSVPLIKNLQRCREHLSHDRPIVVKTEKSVFYAICPLFVAIIKKHGRAAFDQMIIPAIEVTMSDDEVEKLFWAKVRGAFSLHKVCRAPQISIHNCFGDELGKRTKPPAHEHVEDFNSQVASYNEHLRLSGSNDDVGSDRLTLWSTE